MSVRVMMLVSPIGVLLRSVMSLMSTSVATNVRVALIEVITVTGWQATRSWIIAWTEVAAN